MKLSYEMRVCVRCRVDATSERLSCHMCHKRFCSHSAAIDEKGICRECKSAIAEERAKRASAA